MDQKNRKRMERPDMNLIWTIDSIVQNVYTDNRAYITPEAKREI